MLSCYCMLLLSGVTPYEAILELLGIAQAGD